MIIIMNHDVTEEQIDTVVIKIQNLGHEVNISRGTKRIVISAIGDVHKLDPKMFDSLPGVESSMHIIKQYKIVSRESHEKNTIIDANGIPIGGNQMQVIGGPYSVETPEQMDLAAQSVAAAGCRLMRGGAFKPRTSPYTFQGKGVGGLEKFRQAAPTNTIYPSSPN